MPCTPAPARGSTVSTSGGQLKRAEVEPEAALPGQYDFDPADLCGKTFARTLPVPIARE